MRSKKRNPPEFSKKIFIGVSIVNLFVLIFACIMIWRTMDLTPLSYLIPAAAAEMATATGFYYRKAQKENELKIPHYLAQNTNDNEAPAADENI